MLSSGFDSSGGLSVALRIVTVFFGMAPYAALTLLSNKYAFVCAQFLPLLFIIYTFETWIAVSTAS